MFLKNDEENEIEHESKLTEFSTPLKIEEIDEIYDRQKSDFLKIAMKLNQIDFESATEVADSENEALIQEIINPMPGLIVDDDISVNTQFSFQNSDLDTSFALSDTLKARLDDILQDARTKISSISYPPEAIPEDIPNDPLYPLSQIKTEDIYIDESLRDMLYPGGEELYFPQPSTDDRKDFEINIPESEMIDFKSPSLTFASIEKKRIKNHINPIQDGLFWGCLRMGLLRKICHTNPTMMKLGTVTPYLGKFQKIHKSRDTTLVFC